MGGILFALDLALHSIKVMVTALHLPSDSLVSEGLDEDLNTSTTMKHQVQSGLILDVVVGESAAILKLLARKDTTRGELGLETFNISNPLDFVVCNRNKR